MGHVFVGPVLMKEFRWKGLVAPLVGFLIGLTISAPVLCVTEHDGDFHSRTRCSGLVIPESNWGVAVFVAFACAVVFTALGKLIRSQAGRDRPIK